MKLLTLWPNSAIVCTCDNIRICVAIVLETLCRMWLWNNSFMHWSLIEYTNTQRHFLGYITNRAFPQNLCALFLFVDLLDPSVMYFFPHLHLFHSTMFFSRQIDLGGIDSLVLAYRLLKRVNVSVFLPKCINSTVVCSTIHVLARIVQSLRILMHYMHK